MATNINAPWGFAPIRYLNGASWNGQARRYCISSADTNAYRIGDPLMSDTTNYADSNGVAALTLATAGSAVRGILVGMGGLTYGGFSGDPNALNTLIIPATKSYNYYVDVVDDPNVLFAIQEGGAGSVLTAAAVGANANFNAGSPVSGVNVSAFFLDNNTVNNTSTLNCLIMEAAQNSTNVFGSAYQTWIVLLNNHELRIGRQAAHA